MTNFRRIIGSWSGIFTNWNPHFLAGHFAGHMTPGDLIQNGISTLNSQTTAQEEVDAAAVNVDAVKNANQPPEDAAAWATALSNVSAVLKPEDLS